MKNNKYFYIFFNHFANLQDRFENYQKYQPSYATAFTPPIVVAHSDWWPSTAVGEPPRWLDLTAVSHDGKAQPSWATTVMI
jgi:hypothetical protein